MPGRMPSTRPMMTPLNNKNIRQGSNIMANAEVAASSIPCSIVSPSLSRLRGAEDVSPWRSAGQNRVQVPARPLPWVTGRYRHETDASAPGGPRASNAQVGWGVEISLMARWSERGRSKVSQARADAMARSEPSGLESDVGDACSWREMTTELRRSSVCRSGS